MCCMLYRQAPRGCGPVRLWVTPKFGARTAFESGSEPIVLQGVHARRRDAISVNQDGPCGVAAIGGTSHKPLADRITLTEHARLWAARRGIDEATVLEVARVNCALSACWWIAAWMGKRS